jgi:hypothetical protein
MQPKMKLEPASQNNIDEVSVLSLVDTQHQIQNVM